MFNADIYSSRRAKLLESITEGIIVLPGNEESSMNYKDNVYPFRQDSNFLYFIGIDQPHMGAIIDADEGRTILFGHDPSLDEIVWIGPQPSLTERAERVGITDTKEYDRMADFIRKAKSNGRAIHILPPYRPENTTKLADWLETDLKAVAGFISEPLIQAVVAQRSVKSAPEVAEMEKALNVTAAMHITALQQAREGATEAKIAGIVEGMALASGGRLAYPAIVTVNGQTLHNHYHGNILRDKQLLLCDFGAETEHHYAADITRTFPVGGAFTPRQQPIYELVLQAQLAAIEALRPGVPFVDVHKLAARVIVEGLKDLGLMKGDTAEAVEVGAHALFFPHGLGHMIGLDVHDMEDLGEQIVGYGSAYSRSPQFGLKSLRLARVLETGFVVTIEPGIYFIPELIAGWREEGQHSQFINYAALDDYLDFGGIRIEDNILITENGHRVLGNPIPKTVDELQS